MRHRIEIILGVTLLLMLSCSKEQEVHSPGTGGALLVFMAGDNDLSGEVEQRVEALLEGWGKNPPGSKLYIFADSKKAASPVLMQATSKNCVPVLDTIKRYREKNSASSLLFTEVIHDFDRVTQNETDKGMVVFSHATGWLPEGAFEDPLNWGPTGRSSVAPRSVLDDQGREMELQEFATAIPDGMFNFIAFDICFMAGVEVAYALRHKCKYMVASAAEMLSPGFIPIYPTHLPDLYKHEAGLTAFADAYFGEAGQSATISVIATGQLEQLAVLVAELKDRTLTQQQINRIQYFDRKGKPHLFFDLRDYLQTLVETHFSGQEAADWQSRINEALAGVVLLERHTRQMINIPVVAHCGLSIYIEQDNLPRLNNAWRNTGWGQRINS